MLIPSPDPNGTWMAWGYQLVRVLQAFVTDIGATAFRQGQIAQLGSFAVADLPSTTTPGRMIYVSDEVGGAVLAFSDGTNWRRVTDRAIVA